MRVCFIAVVCLAMVHLVAVYRLTGCPLGLGKIKLTPQEIRTALEKPWIAQSLGRLITQYESEWYDDGTMSKWNALDGYMNEAGMADWEQEKQRIRSLLWWSDLAEVKNASNGVAWHINPMSIIHIPSADPRELRVRAFLRLIRIGEGTIGASGYETLFGGSSFVRDYGRDFKDHPQIKVKKGSYTSSAAGAYQIMGYTWTDISVIKIRKRFGITDFSPLSQDKLCVAILKFKLRDDALSLIIDKKIREAVEVCSWEWASLPPGRYGQPIETMENVLRNYEKLLLEEEKGISDLYLLSGFLKEFGYT